MRICAYSRPDAKGEYLRFLKQYGIEDVVLTVNDHPDAERRFARENADKPGAQWEFLDLMQAALRLAGLACETLAALVIGLGCQEGPLAQ